MAQPGNINTIKHPTPYQEYPKWIGDKIVHSADEEAKVTGKPVASTDKTRQQTGKNSPPDLIDKAALAAHTAADSTVFHDGAHNQVFGGKQSGPFKDRQVIQPVTAPAPLPVAAKASTEPVKTSEPAKKQADPWK